MLIFMLNFNNKVYRERRMLMELNGIQLRNQLLDEYKDIIKNESLEITLSIIQIGHNEASNTYIKNKIKYAKQIGINVIVKELEEDISEEEVYSIIDSLNKDPMITGILIQSPVPKHIDFNKCIERISPRKDVEGLTKENIYKIYENEKGIIPCTAKGILKLLDYYKIPIAGQHITIINRSDLIGKPLIHLLLERDATVTICHSKTKNIKDYTINADIIISGVGKENFLTEDMVKDNFIGIDAGIIQKDNKIIGDFSIDIKNKASYYTPVPGGVGPMTIAMIMENLIELKRMSREESNI